MGSISPADAPNDSLHTLGWMDLVIGNIDDGVCVTSKDGFVVFANNAFANMLQQSRIFLLGQKLDELFKVETIRKPVREFAGAENESEDTLNSSSEIYFWRDKQEKSYILRIKKKNLKGLSQTVYLIQDITREYSLIESRSDIISLASHQLRTPVTALLNYSHMLADGYAGELTDSQKGMVDALVNSSERMVRLIDGLLNIARIQNDKYIINAEAIDLKNLIANIVQSVSAKLEVKKITVDVSISRYADEIITDEFILREVITNLLLNAIQYSHPSSTIKVSVRKNKLGTSITVKDNGIGISEVDKDRIFDQFFRAEEAYDMHPEGTGLGMYLIKIMTEKVGGNIQVKSVCGEGTSISILLPNEIE